MKKCLVERQEHLKLNEPCVERGGSYSTALKGLLAHILDTTMPSGMKIHICHACHNEKCSNPFHLYWGTPVENRLDAIKNGRPTIADNLVKKYGIDGANEIRRRGAIIGGQRNKGKPKSEEHRKKLSISIKKVCCRGTVATATVL